MVRDASDTLTAVGHIGWDVVRGADGETRSLGGSLTHFLHGASFAHTRTEARTWTEPEVAAAVARRLPPWMRIANHEVPAAPLFTIEYDGERVVRFDIENIEMPLGVAATAPEQDVHFTAMPMRDVRALLSAWRPRTWTMQLHEAVMPEELDLDAAVPAPDVVFCNASEWDRIERRGPFSDPRTTWVITSRDRVVLHHGTSAPQTYAFDPIDDVVDATGAGDVLAGAMLGALRHGVPLAGAVRFGAGVASMSLFAPSSEGLVSWWT